MPYDNVPEPLWGKMDSCVEQVMSEGKDKETSVAICYTSLVESEQPHAIEAALGEPSQSGHTWEVTAIAPKTPNDLVTVEGVEWILSPNGRAYAVNGLRDYARFFEGAQVFDDHLTDKEFQARQGMRSFLTEGVGILNDVSFNPERRAVCGTLHVVDDAAAAKLLRMQEADVLKNIGLSIDVNPIPGKPITANGRRYETVVGFEGVNSVDVVSKPATGGGFDRLIESEIQEAIVMDEEQLKALIAKILEEMGIKPPKEAPPMEAAKPEPAQESAPPAVDAEIADKVRKLECERLLTKRLAASKLPEADARIVESAFADRVFSESDLDEVLKRAKEAQASRDATGQPVGVGGGSQILRPGLDPLDAKLCDLLYLTARTSDLPRLSSVQGQDARVVESIKSWERAGSPRSVRRLSDWYRAVTEKGDPFRGSRAIESVSVAYLIQDATNVFVALDYSQKSEWWEPIVTVEEVDTIDTANLVTTYALSSLPVIAKGAAYTELQYTDKEETASYVKTGGYIGITREDLLLDKTGKLRNMASVMADAWYNSQSERVAALFTTNANTGPILADTGALFNATAVGTAGGHANLGTTALSYTTFDAGAVAMMKQTDRPLGAGRAMRLRPRYLLIPVDLRSVALDIRNNANKPGTGNNDANAYYQTFDVIEVPEWTDTNNWAMVCDKAVKPMIYMVYPRGSRTPGVFIASDETSGAMFTNDELRYKNRAEFYRYSATYDCAPVADSRGLYKANVA